VCATFSFKLAVFLYTSPGKLVVNLIVGDLGMTVFKTAMGVVVAGTNEKMSLFHVPAVII
jgi:hypothetical protein